MYGGKYGEAICAANNHEQSIDRVFAAIRRIIEWSPLLRAEAKITADKITILGGVISAIPSNYASAAGANPVVSVFDELWAYSDERSRRLFDELVPPPTRRIACRLTVTYAGFAGESALLEDLHRRGLKQPQLGPDLYAGRGILMFWSHKPVAPWQDEAWLARMRRSLAPHEFQRMIENKFVMPQKQFIDLAAWDNCVDPKRRQLPCDRRLSIWVGVDASTKRDSTAIVAVTWEESTERVHLVTHRVFQPTPDEPLNFEATVERTLHDWNRSYYLRKTLFDPYQMHAPAQRLTRSGLRMIEFAQTPENLTAVSQNLFDLIKHQRLVLYPDPDMRLAISQTVALDKARGWRIDKEKQSHKIDVVSALAMAAYAAVHYHGESDYDTNLVGFNDDDDWQSFRTSMYIASGGTIKL